MSLESLEERISVVRRRAHETFIMPTDNGAWVRDVLEDAVIIQIDETNWRVPYSIDSDGSVQFGDRDSWQAVELKYVTV
jgi:hypothetical protein